MLIIFSLTKILTKETRKKNGYGKTCQYERNKGWWRTVGMHLEKNKLCMWEAPKPCPGRTGGRPGAMQSGEKKLRWEWGAALNPTGSKGKGWLSKNFKDVFIDLKGKLRERERKRALIHWFTPQVPPTAGGNGMKWWVYCNAMQRRSKHIHMRDLQEAHLKIHHLKTVHRSQKLLHANKLSSGPFSNNVVEYPHISH